MRQGGALRRGDVWGRSRGLEVREGSGPDTPYCTEDPRDLSICLCGITREFIRKAEPLPCPPPRSANQVRAAGRSEQEELLVTERDALRG